MWFLSNRPTNVCVCVLCVFWRSQLQSVTVRDVCGLCSVTQHATVSSEDHRLAQLAKRMGDDKKDKKNAHWSSPAPFLRLVLRRGSRNYSWVPGIIPGFLLFSSRMISVVSMIVVLIALTIPHHF